MRHGTSVQTVAAAMWRATVIGMLAAGALAFPITGAAAGSTADCTMQPVVRDHTITQGLGSYAELTPGKDTLVRLYLSMPACAPADAEMQLTSATIAAQSGVTTVPVSSKPALPAPPLTGEDTNTYPPIASFAAAPMKDATGDPLFLIEGRAFSGLLPPSSGLLSVTAELGYRYRIAGGTWTYSDTNAPSMGSFTAAFGAPSNPLRVLVVPMGDRSARLDQQFPTDAVSTVEGGMLALSRLLPVAAGVGDLTSTEGGVRYRALPAGTSMLDLGPAPSGLGLMGGGKKFCGDKEAFDLIQPRLADYLSAWNSTHPDFPADRVVGAIWEGVSDGPNTVSGCADGWAKVPGRAAWVRVRKATQSAASNAGALLGMELLHTWGAVPKHMDNYEAGYHSENEQADKSLPDRGYHVADRTWLANDRAAMRYHQLLTTWNEHNTLLEPEDWLHTRCAFAVTEPDVEPCAPLAVGTAPAALQQYFSLSGVTHGTPETTDLHTHLSEERVDTPEAGRDFLLVQRNVSGEPIDDFGVPTSDEYSAHTGGETHGHGGYELSAVVPVADGAVRFELWRGEPGASGSVLLYAREDDARPTAGTPTTAPAAGDVADIAAAPDRDEVRPAVTTDGLWTAWVEPGGIRVAPTDRSKTISAPLAGGTDPSWADDGRALVFMRDGDVVRVAVDTSGAAATFDDEYVLYNRRLHLSADPSASRPSVGPDGRHVAVSINGDLYVLDSSFRPSETTPLLCPVGATVPAGPCRRVSGTPEAETAPSWSDAGIFHQRNGAIWVVEPDGSDAQEATAGTMPAARGTQLVFVRGGQLWSRSPGDSSEHPLTTGTDDAWPAITSSLDVVAFDRGRSGQRDVVMVDASESKYVVTATDDNPEDLRLDVFLGDDDLVPVEVGLRPVAVSGSEATFELRLHNDTGAGGTLSGRITDGWNVAWLEWGDPVPGSPAEPDLSIHTPIPGAEVLQFSSLSLSGDARLDGTPLPDSALHWTVVGPDGTTVAAGTGRTVDVDPPTDGWTPGAHEIRLTATTGAESATQVHGVVIAEDRDRDGVPPGKDRRKCTESADDDPTNFDDDSDGDGIPEAEDSEPCDSANNGTADFEPDVYYVPSSGLPFSVVVHSSSVDLRKVSAETVAIREVGRYPVEIPAVSWSANKKGGGYTAKFNRAALDAVLHSHPELIGGYVPIVVTGGPPAGAFRVLDPTAPNVQPA